MENEILDSLSIVGYNGNLDPSSFASAINDVKISPVFRNIVAWIAEEIAALGQTDERISSDDDLNTFMMELSAFLKEIQCPFSDFMSGPVSSRLQTPESRSLLLEYLLSELMAYKMSKVLKGGGEGKKDLAITLQETPTAAALTDIARTLNLGKPPDNITPKALFDKIGSKLEEVVKRHDGRKRIGKPLLGITNPLSDESWAKLTAMQQELEEEYNLRRKMLLTRLECTVQSFLWSDRIKGKEAEITERYAHKKRRLEELSVGGKLTDIPTLLAARDTLAIIEKTSSANVRRNTRSKIQRHIIGHVPDRGGRAFEHAPPPPEMPSWQKNRAGGPGGGGYQGRGGGRGGNRGGQNRQNQGGGFQRQDSWQSNQGRNQGDYQGGGYQGQQGGYQGQGGGYQGQGGGYQGHQGGRVQGGWSQRGNDGHRGGYDNRDRRNSGGNDDRRNSGSFGGPQEYNRGDHGQQRGRSNYNRGGGRR